MHRLYYKDFVSTFFGLRGELIFKVCHLWGQNPRFREYVVVILEQFFHSHEISAQIILSWQLIHASEVINALVILQFGKLIGQHSLCVVPIYVPVGVLIVGELESELLNSLLYDSIPAFTRAKQELLRFGRFFRFFLDNRFTFSVRGVSSFISWGCPFLLVMLGSCISFCNVLLIRIVIIKSWSSRWRCIP